MKIEQFNIADYSNDRIVQWIEGEAEGILLGKLRWPKFIHLDQRKHLYSIDGYYNRIMRWLPGQINGTSLLENNNIHWSQPSDLVLIEKEICLLSNYEMVASKDLTLI